MPSLKIRPIDSHSAAACARAWQIGRLLAIATCKSPLHTLSSSPNTPVTRGSQQQTAAHADMLADQFKHAKSAKTRTRQAFLCVVLVGMLALAAACQPVPVLPATTREPVAPVGDDSMGTPSREPTTTGMLSLLSAPSSTLEPIVAPFASDANVPVSPEEAAVAALAPRALSPVRLVIPDAGMDVPVQPMGWRTTRAGDTRTTQWILPESAAGWHVDSAQPGRAGNVILSGRQLEGDVFAPIAQDALRVGQEIILVASDGSQYMYTIIEISDPLPVQASAEIDARVQGYVTQTPLPTLTLITGWPDFTTTHRIFVVATLEP